MARTATLDQTFHALGDPTRRSILDRLREGPATVGELAEPFAMSLNSVSKHILVLERAELVRREPQGRYTVCSLNAEPLRDTVEWATRFQSFWERRLDALDAYVRSADTDESADTGR